MRVRAENRPETSKNIEEPGPNFILFRPPPPPPFPCPSSPPLFPFPFFPFSSSPPFSFWWNHTRSPENFKGGSVRHAPVRRRCNPPEGSPSRAKRGSAERSEAVPPSEARPSRPPSEARLHRAKRGSAERSEAARRSSGGRHYNIVSHYV